LLVALRLVLQVEEKILIELALHGGAAKNGAQAKKQVVQHRLPLLLLQKIVRLLLTKRKGKG